MPSAKKAAVKAVMKKKAAPVKPVKKPTKKPVAKAGKKSAPLKAVKKPVKKAAPVKKVNKPVKKVAPVKKVNKPVKKVAPVKPGKETLTEKPAKKAAPKPSTQASAEGQPATPARLVMLPSAQPAKRKSGPQLKPLRNIPKPLVVNIGDDPWTKGELNAIKRDLQTDLGRLRLELANAEVEIADLLKDSGDGAGDDQADAGTKTFEREHELSLVNNARDMVLQSERALARIELGTYGFCESCGNPIGKARLQVFPRATLCMVCKQREERR